MARLKALPTAGVATESSAAAPFDYGFATPLIQAGIVKEIIVKGNVRQSKEGILASMRTKVGQPLNQATLDQDRSDLFDLGYFKAEPNITVRSNPDGTFTVTVEVVENPIIKEIRIVGNSVMTRDQILAVVTLKTGDIFSNREAKITSNSIAALYAKKGYFAEVIDLAYLPESPQTLNIQILETTVTSVTVTGNTRTKKHVLDRLIKTRAGQIFDTNRWVKDLRRVQNTGWFDKVEPKEDVSGGAGQVALGVNVREQHTGQFGLGIQVDPQSSFAGFVRYGDSNWNGTGQSFSSSFTQTLRGGGPSVDFGYGNPFIDSHDTSMNIQLFSRIIYRFTNNAFGGTDLGIGSEYSERRTGGIISFARPLADTITGSISTRFEGVSTNVATELTNGFIQQDGTIASMAFALSRNRRDLDTSPSRGDYATLTVEPGYSNITKVGGLISDQSSLGSSFFTKYVVDYRAYFSPGQRPRTRDKLDDPRRVVAFRVRAGTITGQVPFFEQFFAGGADTVRGYDEDRYWGKNELLTTAEYRYPIQKGFDLIPFLDYGGAWGGYGSVNTFYQTNSFRMHLGYGVGISFRTPLGPIRLDFGIGEKGGARTHFQIATNF
jgi:outer membrane protein insertion porin family